MLSTIELELLEVEKNQKHSIYDRVKDIFWPGLTAIGAIASAVLGRPASVFWALMGLSLIFLILSLYPSLRASAKRRDEQTANENAARQYFPALRQFVERYGTFVDSRTNDTLHYIVANSLTEPSRSAFVKHLGPNISLWNSRWTFFMQRLNRVQPSFSELQNSVPEFHNMAAEFNNHRVAPVFEYLPAELRAGLSDRDKSALNGFQQSFAHFLDDYMEFAKGLAESRPTLQGLPYYLPRPKPL